MSIEVPRRYLTVRELAAEVRQSEKTIRRKINAGEIPAVQLGPKRSSLRIDVNELDGWLYAEGGR